MSSVVLVAIVSCVCIVTSAATAVLKNGGYEGVVVSVDEKVPSENCRSILNNLEVSLATASQLLLSALGGRAYLRTVTVLLPDTWGDSCSPRYVTPSSGETPDIRMGITHPVFGDSIWTQQSRGCGQPGDFIYTSYRPLLDGKDIGRSLVREWAKYRYGVFDETGYPSDAVYPICYHSDYNKREVTGCSDLPIADTGVCSGSGLGFNASELVHDEAKSSIMFAAESPHITKFCNSQTHNKAAPTKQNFICDMKSINDVILQNADFVNRDEPNKALPLLDEQEKVYSIHQVHSDHLLVASVVLKRYKGSFAFEKSGRQYLEFIGNLSSVGNPAPVVLYKRRKLTRFVVVVEETAAMQRRESWVFLRTALRKWLVHDLPPNTEVGLVLCNETAANRLHLLTPLDSHNTRDFLAATIPYNPGDSPAASCLYCGLREALDMLKDRATNQGPASSVVVMIAPGMDNVLDVSSLVPRSVSFGVRLATINYPNIVRLAPLDSLARATDGTAFTIIEQPYNMAASYITTYFKLAKVMFNIATQYYEGSRNSMPIEVHSRELFEDGRSTVRGTFVLEEDMGEPAQFNVFTHNTANPLIKSMTVTSPSQVRYTRRSDSMLTVKMLTLPVNLSETGTWTYEIERVTGNPQPHFIQVIATPKSKSGSVVRAHAWTSAGNIPLILYTEVKRGDFPVLAAKVEVIVTYAGKNGSGTHQEKFELLDTGSGDPDITKGDGVYTRYFSAFSEGLHTFEISVTDNGNMAYSWQESIGREIHTECCGSVLPMPALQPLSPFQRILPPISIIFSHTEASSRPVVGKIGDLRAYVHTSDLKARLSWTAPDTGFAHVARYEIRFAHSLTDIINHYDTIGRLWEYGSPLPLVSGSETTFTLDFTRNPSLLDQPMYIRMRAFSESLEGFVSGPVSNWVYVLVPSPPPAPTVAPIPASSTQNLLSWSNENADTTSVIPGIAHIDNFWLELILPIIGGLLLLLICLFAYCYICVIRRRRNPSVKKHKSDDKVKQHMTSQSSPITILPSSPSNNSLTVPQTPPDYEAEDEKNHVSVSYVQQDDKIVTGEHNQILQQQHREQIPHVVALSSPNGANTDNIPSPNEHSTPVIREGRILSPYQSWTASQLLHEHERRQSPYGCRPNEEITNNGKCQQYPPHVSPLQNYPANHNNIYSPGNAYGVHHGSFSTSPEYNRNGSLVPFNPTVQGSLNSVNSTDRKKRNVTMV